MNPIIIGVGAYLLGKYIQRKRDEKEVKEAMDEVTKDIVASLEKEKPNQRSYRQYYGQLKGTDLDKEKPNQRSYRQYYGQLKGTDLDDVVIETLREAEKVLVLLHSLVEKYGFATVADLCDMVGLPSRYRDRNFGWTDLTNAFVSPVEHGYVIVFPSVRLVV